MGQTCRSNDALLQCERSSVVQKNKPFCPVVEVVLARWPVCPSNSGVAQVLGLIPISVAGEGIQVGGGDEQNEPKLETRRSDMV